MLGGLIGNAAVPAIEAVGNVVDKLFTSDEERLDKQVLLERLAQQPQLAQIELNKIEAAHRSVFVAGWRPFIGWVCGLALFYNYVFRDLMAWTLQVYGVTNDYKDAAIAVMSTPPELSIETLTSVLIALLGLGSLRTIEKVKGRAK